MPTILEQFKAKGIVEGEARGKISDRREMVLTILQARFHRVPTDIAQAVDSMVDLIALKSLAVHAATCQSLTEFSEYLN